MTLVVIEANEVDHSRHLCIYIYNIYIPGVHLMIAVRRET